MVPHVKLLLILTAFLGFTTLSVCKPNNLSDEGDFGKSDSSPQASDKATTNGTQTSGDDHLEDTSIEHLENVTGGRYMLELYRQLSKSSQNMPITQANIIKSLKYERLNRKSL